MQGLVVVGLIVEKIWNTGINCAKVTRALNIGQGHQVKVPAKSVSSGRYFMQGLMVVWSCS